MKELVLSKKDLELILSPNVFFILFRLATVPLDFLKLIKFNLFCLLANVIL